MKVWRRISPGGSIRPGLSYDTITEIDEAGNYCSRNVWSDGKESVVYRSTLSEMGWPSIEAFLREKRGFTLLEK